MFSVFDQKEIGDNSGELKVKFEVRVPIEGYATYIVAASSEQEAREIAYDGDAVLSDSYWENSDTEYNPVEVSLLED